MSDKQDTAPAAGGTPKQVAAPDDAAIAAWLTQNKIVVTNEVSGSTIWRIIGAILLTILALALVVKAQNLVSMLVISFFFSLALIPLVERLHAKHGWKRGAAVGVIYAAFAGFIIVMVVFLIPMMVEVAQTIGSNWSTWMTSVNDWAQDTFNVSLNAENLGGLSDAGQTGSDAAEGFGKQALGGFLGALSTGIGLIFSVMTIALFTFYFTADHIRIQKAVLSWFSPATQERLGWTWDQAVEQTGGYFYSRLILMVINGSGFFFTMVLVGMPVLVSIPLAIFAGFVSEFIPAVGTYIGGAIPVMLTLALQGFTQALIVLAYVLIYQQIENYWLSPKLSSKTMTLNGGVAFGAALAGGAIGGPMGAFMALPIAALITSFITHYRKPKTVVFTSEYDDSGDLIDPDADGGDSSGSDGDGSATTTVAADDSSS